MWTKIFLALLAVAVAAMCILTFLSYQQLQSVGFAPKEIAADFLSYASIYWTCLWISALILLIFANVILWLSQRAWALWSTLLYFVIFTLIRTWWLNEVYVTYVRENNLSSESIFGLGIIGALLCIAAAAGIFFNQFLVVRMHQRLYNAPQPLEPVAVEPDDVIDEIDDNDDGRVH